MKLFKSVTDKMLKKTKSEPKELLDWFYYIYSNHKHSDFPCLVHPYLGKYQFYHETGRIKFPEEIEIGYPVKNVEYIFDLWNYARLCDDNFNEIVSQFKKMYGLE